MTLMGVASRLDGDVQFVEWLLGNLPADMHLKWVHPSTDGNLPSAGRDRGLKPSAMLATKTLVDLQLRAELFVARAPARADVLDRSMDTGQSAARLDRAAREERRLQQQEAYDILEAEKALLPRPGAGILEQPGARQNGARQNGVRRPKGKNKRQSFLDRISKPVRHRPYRAVGLRIR